MATPSSHQRRSSPPPLMAVFGSARPSLASLSRLFSLLFSSFLSHSLPHGFHGFLPSLKLTAYSHSHSHSLDLNEPVYGSRVLCEPVRVAVCVCCDQDHRGLGFVE
uniref:Uncharacterized protein n=1 Tax=Fagus sylvatica TaxID=28930 RepID=A0A2N9ESD1_FAGSY